MSTASFHLVYRLANPFEFARITKNQIMCLPAQSLFHCCADSPLTGSNDFPDFFDTTEGIGIDIVDKCTKWNFRSHEPPPYCFARQFASIPQITFRK